MDHAAQGAPSRVLRAEAQNKRLFALWMEAKSATSALGIKVRSLQGRVKGLEANKRARTEESVQTPPRSVVGFRILDGLSDEAARSLCGVDGLTGLEVSSRDSPMCHYSWQQHYRNTNAVTHS